MDDRRTNDRGRERYPRRPDPRDAGARKPGPRRDDAPRDGGGRDGSGRGGGGKKPRREVAGMPARQAALDMLRLVSRGDSLDKALGVCRSFEELEGSDRAFARQLTTTVLRRQGSLDEVIETYLREPIGPQQAELRLVLRLLAAQILLLDTPPHAAGMTATELAKGRRETAGFARLVNALGRRMAETGKERLEKVPLRADTPGWLWRRFERAYGAKAARAIAEAHRREPPLDLTVPKDRESWAEALEAEPVGPMTLRRQGGGRIEDLPGYAEGAWWIQDLAATLPVALMGEIEGLQVLDLCAAPGGKTMQLCARGAEVTAVDSGAGRMGLLEANLERTGLKARCVVGDVLLFEPDRLADMVLLDAPCSATGTARRNPDVLRSKDEALSAGLAKLQDRMIDRALTFLKPGGLLVFATCSLLPEEGEERAEAALGRHPDLARVPVSPDELAGLSGLVNKAGDLRCHPGKAPGMDGFFATRLRKA
ncbi:RsmB/NOP family class I SAM-dependent RNA methyltransferase [Parvularcula oceani]|uniref:RsmB/NOP family class I SAM-dependent RNA methyltransferase n=1 Tax=Parvularcula oceani TaxID=1247963 RepID=UPI00068D6A36|nr:RsmB/NOP family class I SAM-dependent RNA methyltransferase [Parvularcula oceani]